MNAQRSVRQPVALCFDVFGTTVDWRTSIIVEGEALGQRLGLDRDWEALADQWRAMYQPSMERVRRGEVPWKPLDELHMESLDHLIAVFDLPLSDHDRRDFNRAWHRLAPWPEVVPALLRLADRYTLSTLSNANIELAANMAERAGLPWHHILGAEVARSFKTRPEVYLASADAMGLEPEQCVMVAAHNADLVAAAALGFGTAFVRRTTEYGPSQQTDLRAAQEWDIIVEDFTELADALLPGAS